METTWDQSRFDAALQRYVEMSKKKLPIILNSKAFFISRKALWFTDRATVKEMIRIIQPTERRLRAPAGGGRLLGAIISKRKAMTGKPGLYGIPMRDRFMEVIASRRRSLGFLKSAYIPAIQALDPKAEDKGDAVPMVRGMKQYGVPKGRAVIASENNPVAAVINSAQARSAPAGSAYRNGIAGLQKAFDDEAASMDAYMEKKLAKAADEARKAFA